MRTVLLGVAFLTGSGLCFVACNQDPVSAATSTSGTGGTGGAPNCDGVYLVLNDKDGGHPCDICVHEKCCAEMAACRDKACLLCANNSSGAGCTVQSQNVENCANQHCLSTCSPGTPPLTSSASGD